MNPKDYSFDEGNNILVTTKDTTYQLKGKDYHLLSDTLFAKVEKKIDRKTTHISTIGIPLVNMENVEIERNDAIGTLGTVLGVLVGAFALIIIISLGLKGFFG